MTNPSGCLREMGCMILKLALQFKFLYYVQFIRTQEQRWGYLPPVEDNQHEKDDDLDLSCSCVDGDEDRHDTCFILFLIELPLMYNRLF